MLKKYKDFETKELGRRAAKKKKIGPYKSLKNKKIPISIKRRLKARKLSTRGFMKALGNPYK